MHNINDYIRCAYCSGTRYRRRRRRGLSPLAIAITTLLILLLLFILPFWLICLLAGAGIAGVAVVFTK